MNEFYGALRELTVSSVLGTSAVQHVRQMTPTNMEWTPRIGPVVAIGPKKNYRRDRQQERGEDHDRDCNHAVSPTGGDNSNPATVTMQVGL